MFGLGKRKKTAVLVLPPKQFDEAELHALEKALRHHHIKCILASTSTIGPIYGMNNHKFKAEIKIADIQPDQIDALIFVGGQGARELWNDVTLHRIIQTAHKMDKILGAIDYAPLTLAHADVLKGKCATILVTEEQKLQASGAHYTGAEIEIDGNIITAKDPTYVKEFADGVARMIQGEMVPQAELVS